MHEHTHVQTLSPLKQPRKVQRNLLGESYYLEELDKGYKVTSGLASRASFNSTRREPIPQITVPKHLHHFEAEPICCNGYIMGKCFNGHHFAKAILCGKEFCVDCGKNWSWIHQRRHYRWLPKVKSMRTVGYLVVTVPPEARSFILDKQRLSEFRRYCIRLLKREGFTRGLCRWHWCGEDGYNWHPHLNFLFPGAWMSKEKLEELRNKICAKLSTMLKRPLNTIVLNYRYSDQEWKKKHWCKYVTRSTWRKFSEPLAHVVKGYTNNVTWGKWEKKIKDNSVAKLERGCCPLCDAPITWGAFAGELNKDDWTLLKAGYFIWNYKEPDP